MKKVIISGGSGLIGSKLTDLLKAQGHEVFLLSRDPDKKNANYIYWDPVRSILEPGVFQYCDTLIHLAGAGIGDKRWTSGRKKEIIESRVKSTELLFEKLNREKHQVKTIIAASATGYYGNRGNELLSESASGDSSFLSETCKEWEKASSRFEELGIRLIILRIGFVLSGRGGALPLMSLPVKLFAGAALGKGDQYISWIHIDDLCRIFLHAMDNERMKGIYNAVAPNPVTNHQFYKLLAEKLKRPLWPFNIPSFLLRTILGEKADLVLHGQRVSGRKLSETGFDCRYKDLKDALDHLD